MASHLDVPLSTAMRTGSQAEHEAAEGSRFMTELLAGRINEVGYATYLLRLRQVYAALESVPRLMGDDPYVAAVHDDALARLAAIDSDLEAWASGATLQAHSPAATAYCERILDARAWGGLYAAHHYTRYLGDLSGGQAIGRILDREFGLSGRGTAFYDFAGVGKPKPYKDAYRARLDALGANAEEKRRVVEEVKVAFRLNQALFTELGQEIDAFRRVT
ncbi:biliverdin-producing heme oxygenase [Nocardioides sp.]|uniref:biliverdin-producing heme oxygenase n=1 Tax=Nocardioides sp. TaxID=35761 RepID=UPI0025F1A60A|nr:biliverdin-producing heme oxygenase [Nocardioides sp.]